MSVVVSFLIFLNINSTVSHCTAFSVTDYPNCTSFPGPPLEMHVMSYLHKGKPAVQVTWKAPNTGLCKNELSDGYFASAAIIIFVDGTASDSKKLKGYLGSQALRESRY